MVSPEISFGGIIDSVGAKGFTLIPPLRRRTGSGKSLSDFIPAKIFTRSIQFYLLGSNSWFTDRTEGYDIKVLKGAESLFRKGGVGFAQFEWNFHWFWGGPFLREATALLENLGFALLLIQGAGFHPLNCGFWGDYLRYSNFLACRSEDKHLIQALLGRQL